jgi:hypothetical protein
MQTRKFFGLPNMDEDTGLVKLTFEDRGEYLYVRATGMHTDHATADRSLTVIAAKCKELGSTKLLIYRDITQVIEIAAMFQVASRLPQELPGVRTAFVNPHSSNRNNLEFGREIIAKTGAEIGLFSDEPAAIEWLLAP